MLEENEWARNHAKCEQMDQSDLERSALMEHIERLQGHRHDKDCVEEE